MITLEIPVAFQIMGHKFEVNINNDHCVPENNLGVHYGDYNKIYLAGKSVKDGKYQQLPDSIIAQTFLHELTHAILSKMNKNELNKDEEFVDVFSGLLHQALTTMEYKPQIQ